MGIQQNTPNTLWSGLAITGTNAYTSDAIAMYEVALCAIVLTTTSTATGAAKLQGSVDGVTWVDLANSGQTANLNVTGANSYYWNLSGISFRQLRVVYTNTANSGTISGVWYAKSFG